MKKYKAIFIVVVASLTGIIGADAVYCYFNYSPKDDGALKTEALIGPAFLNFSLF